MDTTLKKSQLFAYIAIIAIAVLISISILRNRDSTNPQPRNSINPVAENQKLIGTKFPAQDVDWKKSKQTLVLILSKTCHYCTESVPFYQRLMKDGNTQVVAVTSQTVSEGREYLKNIGLTTGEVRQGNPGSIGVVGAPTLVLVNNEGIVINVWSGKLSPEQEEEVLNQLRANSAKG